jgi:DNA-binding NtrC family response regulator
MTEKKSRILVVDDLDDWRKTLSGLLMEEGYKVDVADSYNKAMKLLRSKKIDLAILDVRLDETDENNTQGLDLASEIKRHWASTKTIVITGYDSPEIVRRAMEPQVPGKKRLADDFVAKTETDNLVKSVQLLLKK